MGSCIHKLLELNFSMQQHSQEFNMRLFSYSLLKYRWTLIPAFISTILNIIFTLYVEIKIDSKVTYILCIFNILLLFLAINIIFHAIETYLYNGTDVNLHYINVNCSFIICNIIIIPFFIIRILIIFVYLPQCSDSYIPSGFTPLTFIIIWELTLVPMLFSLGLIPCLLNAIILIFTAIFIILLSPGFCYKKQFVYYHMNFTLFGQFLAQMIVSISGEGSQAIIVSNYLERKCKLQLNEIIMMTNNRAEYIISEICVLCKLPIDIENNMIRLDCNHIFHAGCLEIYLNHIDSRCLICEAYIDLTQERSIDINSRPIIKFHYYLAMYSLLCYNCRMNNHHTKIYKSCPFFINIGILVILIIVAGLSNIQFIWIMISTLFMLILLQQNTISNINSYYPDQLRINTYLTNQWIDLPHHRLFILDHSCLILLTIFIFIIFLISITLVISNEDIRITIIFYLTTLTFKLLTDMFDEGLIIQMIIFLIIIIFDLFLVVPAVIYYVVIKKLNLRRILLMY